MRGKPIDLLHRGHALERETARLAVTSAPQPKIPACCVLF
jgi:hypothetical protein